MTSNEVHDLKQSGAASVISSPTISLLNTQQACTFITLHFCVTKKKVYEE